MSASRISTLTALSDSGRLSVTTAVESRLLDQDGVRHVQSRCTLALSFRLGLPAQMVGLSLRRATAETRARYDRLIIPKALRAGGAHHIAEGARMSQKPIVLLAALLLSGQLCAAPDRDASTEVSATLASLRGGVGAA